MASYSLIASYSTVQVLSPTVVNRVVYCTIQTHPSNAVVSIPVQERVFDDGQAGVELINLADAVEQVLAEPHVIAATGSQSIDDSGLLADNVIFTVEYVPSGASSSSVTAEATVPVGYLDFTDSLIGQVSHGNVDNIIGGVYANLQNAAGG